MGTSTLTANYQINIDSEAINNCNIYSSLKILDASGQEISQELFDLEVDFSQDR